MAFVKLIPSLITLGNLFLGCLAVLFGLTGRIHWVPILVIAAGTADFLDGLVARLLKVPSEMGKQLDSLADMVSFGVVPSVIMFYLMINALTDTSAEYLAYPAFLIAVASAYRLAKFNLDTRQTEGFIGLPTPSCTAFITSLLFVKELALFNALLSNIYVLYGITLLFSYLLISELPMFALKFKNFKFKGNEIRFLFIAIAIPLMIFLRWNGIAIIVLSYIIFSFFNFLLKNR